MAAYDTTELSPKYHKLISDWQKKHFPELSYMEKHWAEHYPKQTEFQLTSKIGKLRHDTISIGRYKDNPYFEAANDMSGNMFYSAQIIIKAQCSTELGSVQQYRMSIDQAVNDEMKFGILRIMAEELRHAYQMFWVLEHDPTWKKLGMGANDEGDFSVRDIQQHLNKWLARGLEMFGNEEGGTTNIEFGFKSKANGVAQAEYHNEVKDFVRDRKFFRKRGLSDFVFKPYDLHGSLITGTGGAAVGPDRYVEYLKTQLPVTYFDDPEWGKYETELREYHAQGGEGDVGGASYSG